MESVRSSIIIKPLSSLNRKSSGGFLSETIVHVMSTTNHKQQENEKAIRRQSGEYGRDDLYTSLRFFLRLGRVLGIIPLIGIFNQDLHKIEFSHKSIAAFQNMLASFLILMNVVIGLLRLVRIGGRNPSEWAWAAEPFVLYSTALFIFLYFYCRGLSILNVFKEWRKVSTFYCVEDARQFRDVNIIAAIIFTSAVFENIVFHVKILPLMNGTENFTAFLEKYYNHSRTYWPHMVPYNGYIVTIVFISNKLATYSTNFVDILIVITSRAIYGKFKMLLKEGNYHLLQTTKGTISKDSEKWKLLISDHNCICQLVQELEDLLSPLIFSSYAFNIYYICLQVHLGLTSSSHRSTLESVYALWSFFHFVGRVIVVSVSAARIHSYAHNISTILQKCPIEANSFEVDKMERSLAIRKVGLTGLGCFFITKPFILQIVIRFNYLSHLKQTLIT